MRANTRRAQLWLLLIATTAGRQIRHPPDQALAILCWQAEKRTSGCDLKLLGLVAGAEYTVYINIRVGNHDELSQQVVEIAPGDEGLSQVVPFPAGAQGELTISVEVHDASADAHDALLSKLNRKFFLTLPSATPPQDGTAGWGATTAAVGGDGIISDSHFFPSWKVLPEVPAMNWLDQARLVPISPSFSVSLSTRALRLE
jgi:hypothetical protein